MANDIAVAPIGSANTAKNLTVLDAQAKKTKKLDKIAADQAQGILNALKGLRDQAANPAGNAATQALKPEAQMPQIVEKTDEQIAQVVVKTEEQIARIVERTEEKVAAVTQRAEEKIGRFVGTGFPPGLSRSNGSHGSSAARISALSAFADKQLESIKERLSFLHETISALKQGMSSNSGGRSAFNILRRFAGQLGRAENAVSRADLLGAALKVGDLEEALGSLVDKVLEDKTEKKNRGTFLQGGFGFSAFSRGVASGGPTVHAGKDTDRSASVRLNASAGIGLGAFGAARRTGNGFGALLTSFGGVRHIGTASGSKLSVVA